MRRLSVSLTGAVFAFGLSAYSAGTGAQTAAPDAGSPDRGDRPVAAHYQPAAAVGGARPYGEDGPNSYRIEADGGRSATITVRVCIGDSIEVPLLGRLTAEDQLPASADTAGASASLERGRPRYKLTVGAKAEGRHNLALRTRNGGAVRGLHIVVIGRDCSKEKRNIAEIFGAGAGGAAAPAEGETPSAKAGSLAEAAGRGASLKPRGERAKPQDDDAEDAADRAGESAGKAAEAAARKGRRVVSDSAGAAAEAGAAARDDADKVRDTVAGAAKAAEEAGGDVPERRDARQKNDEDEEAPLKDHPYAQPRGASPAFSVQAADRLPDHARRVLFAAVQGQPGLSGVTRLAGAAVPQSGALTLLDPEGRAYPPGTVGARIEREGDDTVLHIPSGAPVAAAILETKSGPLALLAGGAAVAADAPTVLDGVLEAEQGLVRETIAAPPGATHMAAPLGEYSVYFGDRPAEIVALREGQIAIEAQGVTLPADGRTSITVINPAGDSFSGRAEGWGYALQVPDVMRRGGSAEISLRLAGTREDEAVYLELFAEPGQRITPASVLVPGGRNGATLPVATLTTETAGPQSFGVRARRGRLDDDGFLTDR